MAIDDRLLRVLRAFNDFGTSTVTDISRYTTISRPAVHRIVETLTACGYLRRIAGTSSYQLTQQVLNLSSGYREQAWISQVGAQLIAWLQKEVRWPTSLAIPEKAKMIVRETTRFRSPVVFDMGVPGMESFAVPRKSLTRL